MMSTQSQYYYSSSSSSSEDEDHGGASLFDPEYTDDMPNPPQALITAANQFHVAANLLNQLILYIGRAFEPTVTNQLDNEDARESFEANYDGGNGLPSDETVAGQYDTLWEHREEFVDFYNECLGGSDTDEYEDSDEMDVS